MWIDPINWSAFKEAFRDWSNKNCPNLTVTQVIDNRFCERLSPSHPPRSRATGKVNIPNIYHFGSPTPNHTENVNEMLAKGVPIHIAKQISKVNKHHPLLAVLGILPNQLRDLLKTTVSTCDEAFEDISFTLFWHGYQIWKLRRSKVNRFWKEIARDEWKPHSAKQSRNKHKLEEDKCRNPFHFLSRHRNLSQQRRTPCPCSREIEDRLPIYRTLIYIDSFLITRYLIPLCHLTKQLRYRTVSIKLVKTIFEENMIE